MSPEEPSPRVSPFTFPPQYQLPALPPAHRQLRFLLGDDLALFEKGMNLELRVVADSRASRYRTHALAALLGPWSRAFTYKACACSLMTAGGYVSCLPLLRTACDCIAAQKGLAGEDASEFTGWLAQAGQSREHAALDVGLGRYRAGGMVSTDERLGGVYRVVTELSMPHFGATLLQVAPDSDLQKISIAFADGSFHLAWAELILGWLLTLVDAQLATTIGAGETFVVCQEVSEGADRLSQEVATALARPGRCCVEEVEQGRYLFHNFRRQPGASPRRILL